MTTILKILLRTLLYTVYAVVMIAATSLIGEGLCMAFNYLSKWAMPVFIGIILLGICALIATGETLGWGKESDKEDKP